MRTGGLCNSTILRIAVDTTGIEGSTNARGFPKLAVSTESQAFRSRCEVGAERLIGSRAIRPAAKAYRSNLQQSIILPGR